MATSPPRRRVIRGRDPARGIGRRSVRRLAQTRHGLGAGLPRHPRERPAAGLPAPVERAKPGFIAVLPNGKRFTNEADSYHDFIAALLAATPEGEQPARGCWPIAGRCAAMAWATPAPFRFHPRHGCARAISARHPRWRRWRNSVPSMASSWRRRWPVLTTTPRKERTRNFSAASRPITGLRGCRILITQRWACAPRALYAVRILPGSLGSFSGLKTDEQARVLDARQQPIAGLYAIGNDMSSVMQGTTPAAVLRSVRP